MANLHLYSFSVYSNGVWIKSISWQYDDGGDVDEDYDDDHDSINIDDDDVDDKRSRAIKYLVPVYLCTRCTRRSMRCLVYWHNAELKLTAFIYLIIYQIYWKPSVWHLVTVKNKK